jgi:hypothetical protein
MHPWQQLSCLEWLRVLDNNSPLPDAVERLLVPPWCQSGRLACMYVYDTLAGSEEALCKCKTQCRQDELGIVGIFLWYRIGSAPCPSLPSIIDWKAEMEVYIPANECHCKNTIKCNHPFRKALIDTHPRQPRMLSPAGSA